MGIAGSEKPMRLREVRIVLDRQEQLRQGLVEAAAKEECDADYIENLAEPSPWAEAQRNLGAFDCQFAAYLAPLMRKKWFVYAKPPFAGPEAVLAYLARYTHRVASAEGASKKRYERLRRPACTKTAWAQKQ
jgi:hypothetical protein